MTRRFTAPSTSRLERTNKKIVKKTQVVLGSPTVPEGRFTTPKGTTMSSRLAARQTKKMGRGQDYAEAWDSIQTRLLEIFTRELLSNEDTHIQWNRYREVYLCIENLVKASSENALKRISTRFADNLEQFLESQVDRIFLKCKKMTGNDLLVYYNEQWKNFEHCASFVDGSFFCLRRAWAGKRPIDEEFCLTVWKNALGSADWIVDEILERVQEEREGGKIKRTLVCSIIGSYVKLSFDKKTFDFYQDHFEYIFLQNTRGYYEDKVEALQDQPLNDYLKHVQKRLETESAVTYLNRHTKSKVTSVLEQVFILDRLSFITSHFRTLLETQNDKETLSLIYEVCHLVEKALAGIKDVLEQHFIRKALCAIDDQKDKIKTEPMVFVICLVELYKNYSNLIEKIFKNHSGAVDSLNKAAQIFVNRNAVTIEDNQVNLNKLPELLVNCFDMFQKSPKRGAEEAALKQIVFEMMVVFKYLDEKDVFAKNYTKLLAKRLMYDLSINEEYEVEVVDRLKSECGFDYTSRMSRMISDCRISKDITATFTQWMKNKSIHFPELRLVVGNSRSWPTASPLSFRLPMELQQCADQFQKFYEEKYRRKRVTWALAHSRGELFFNRTNSDRKVFVATTAQMSVLLLFNDSLIYTVKNMMNRLQMDNNLAGQTIALLVRNKVLLGKKPGTNGIYNEEEQFTLNQNYANEQYKIDLTRPFVARIQARKSQENKFGNAKNRRSL